MGRKPKPKPEQKPDVTVEPEKKADETPEQAYDSTLKSWVKENPETIIPVICQGAVFQEALDIEIIKPPMRADRVFKVLYKGKPCLLNVEFESGSDTEMRERLLIYNIVLYKQYHVPVISSIIYPFRTSMARSPLRIEPEEGVEMLIFHFFTLPLFQLQADSFLRKHVTCMYPLLPTMQGANAQMIEQAIAELKEVYRDDEVTLSKQVIWMELLLQRTTLLTDEQKLPILEVLKMYDPLWDEHPKVIKIKATAKEDARKEARAEAQAEVAKTKAKLEAEAKEKEAQRDAEAKEKEAQRDAEAKKEKARLQAEAKEEKARLRAEAKEKEARLQAEAKEKEARLRAEAKEKEARLQAEAKEKEARLQAEAKEKEARLRAETKEKEARLQAEAKEKEARLRAETKEKEARLRAETKEKEARLRAEAEMATYEQTRGGLRNSLLDLVRMRFPEQAELQALAQRATAQITTPDGMNHLLFQVASAANESALHHVLRPADS